MHKKKHRVLWRSLTLLVILAFVLGSYSYLALTQVTAPLNPTVNPVQLSLKTASPDLTWPTAGESAVSINTISDIQTHGVQKPVPTASTAKIITALCVLKAKPLQTGQQGPTVTLSAADEAIYNQYVAQDGSVVPVSAGEQITEYQMLQAMLLPSANNIADSMAIWAFGSLNAYRDYAASYVHSLGLTNTQVGSDASGFAPDTLSTAHDLVVLGKHAMQNPVLADVVGQSSADDIPEVSSVSNVNSLLGTSGIIGIKTGNTDQAGGVFLSAANATVANQNVIIVSAYMSAPTLYDALRDTLPLIKSTQDNFKPVSVLKAGSIVGSYRQPWGGTLSGVAAKNIDVTTWKGSIITATISLSSVPHTMRAGQQIGTINVPASLLSPAQHVPITLQTNPTQPSPWWRLLHSGLHLKL